jgi:cytochrome P450
MSDTYQSLRDRAADIKASGRVGTRFKRYPVDPDLNPYDLPLDDLDVANPELFKHGLFERYFERLRAEAPVHWCRSSQYGPYWSITRYDDIMAIEKAHDVFSSDHVFGGVTIMGNPNASNPLPMFIQMDPPKHDQQRRAVAPRFTQRSLAELEGLIRQRVENILDGLPVNEPFDWVERVSVELTGQMLATLFDLPLEDRHRLIRWSNVVSNADNPEYLGSTAEFYEALAECGDYFQALWARRKAQAPAGDLISMLAHGEATRDMGHQELLGNVILLLVGGNDTTRNSISGGLLALNEFPDQYDRLRANPSLVASMVPEIIRWQTPLTHMRRTAIADIEFRGKSIKKGDAVILWYISGNRDEDAIAQANRFIIDRDRPREHLSFGFGIHRCLGNRLAELQLRVLWEELLARYPRIEVAGEPVRANSVLFRAIQELPVQIRC